MRAVWPVWEENEGQKALDYENVLNLVSVSLQMSRAGTKVVAVHCTQGAWETCPHYSLESSPSKLFNQVLSFSGSHVWAKTKRARYTMFQENIH